MTREDLPHIQFYIGDWRRDVGVQSLSYHYRGVWLELLMLMHCSEERGRLVLRGKPMSDDSISRLLGLSRQEGANAIQVLLESAVASRDSDGAFICRRMVKEEEIRRARADSGSKGGKQKSSKTESLFTNENGLSPPSKDQAKPKQNHDSDNGIVDGRLKFPDGFSPSCQEKFREWIEVRQAQGKKPKDWRKMFQAQLDWLANFAEPVALESISASIRNNWQGLHPPKHLLDTSAKNVAVTTIRPMSAFEIQKRQEAITTEINLVWGKAPLVDGKRKPNAEQQGELDRLKTRRAELKKELTK